MGATININAKSNVKQNTDADLISSQLQQPVIARYEATSTASQTVINLPFLVNQSNTDAFDLFIDGALTRLGSLNDFIFTSIDGTNSSSQITLNTPIAANLNIIAIKRGLKKETEFATDSRFIDNYDLMTAGFQGFVDESTKISVPNTTIVNRAQISDLANDARVSMGIDRIQIQGIYELQNEFGATGEKVYGTLSDDRGLIRFVGRWSAPELVTYGRPIETPANSTFSYVEITFYGTGLNMLSVYNSLLDARASVDGGAEGGNLFVSAYSNAIGTRGYNQNMVIPVVSGLTLGIHTVKIRQASASVALDIAGFDVISGTTIKVNPGTGYAEGQKIVSAGTTLSHTTPVTGIRGGRVLTYVNLNGTVGQAFQAVDGAQANYLLADHTNEEVIRTYHPREFGAGRSDDWSTATGAAAARKFTLEDGTTSLHSNAGLINDRFALGFEVLSASAASDQISLTFVGTGLDVMACGGGGATTITVEVDGISIGTLAAVDIPSLELKKIKIVSGLAYGTHTVKIQFAVSALGITKFITYGPKKPAIPAGTMELSNHYVMATYAVNTTANIYALSAGVLRKSGLREFNYVNGGANNWSVADDNNNPQGLVIGSNQLQTNCYVETSFFGTGCEIYILLQNAIAFGTTTVSVNGLSNFTGIGTLYTGAVTGMTFTAATGSLSGTPVGNGYGKIVINGLSLGLHRVRFTTTTGANPSEKYFSGIDVITPVHSPQSDSKTENQNTLPVGSQGISDSRLLSLVKSESPKKFRGVATDLGSNSSTSSASLIPMLDMSITVPSPGTWFELGFQGNFQPIGAFNDQAITQFYINGIAVGKQGYTRPASSTAAFVMCTQTHLVYLSKGTHKIDMYWGVAGTTVLVSGGNIGRQLTVKEL
jgi:hypothetical protein